MKTARQFRKMRVRNKTSDKINALMEKGYSVVWITPYQCRVNEMVDLYPTNSKFHNLVTGGRGLFADPCECAIAEIDKATA